MRGAARSVATWLVTESGDVRVEGDLEPEIRQLGGATLELCGVLEGERMIATAYALRFMAGRPAWTGMLAQGGDEWFIEARGERLKLLGRLSDALRASENEQVWVAGVLEGRAIRVESFGVIRPG